MFELLLLGDMAKMILVLDFVIVRHKYIQLKEYHSIMAIVLKDCYYHGSDYIASTSTRSYIDGILQCMSYFCHSKPYVSAVLWKCETPLFACNVIAQFTWTNNV